MTSTSNTGTSTEHGGATIPDGVDMTDPYADDPAFILHQGGKLSIASSVPIDGPEDLSLAYTPGVGRVSQAIADEPGRVWTLTGRSNAVAVLSNGTAVLGLGDIGPEAAMPVMEGKAVLFKQFGGVDAYPVCVDARTVDEMVAIGKAIAPTSVASTSRTSRRPSASRSSDVCRTNSTSPCSTTTSTAPPSSPWLR